MKENKNFDQIERAVNQYVVYENIVWYLVRRFMGECRKIEKKWRNCWRWREWEREKRRRDERG